MNKQCSALMDCAVSEFLKLQLKVLNRNISHLQPSLCPKTERNKTTRT